MFVRRLAGISGALAVMFSLHATSVAAWEPWDSLVDCVDGALRWNDDHGTMQSEAESCVADKFHDIQDVCGGSYLVYMVSPSQGMPSVMLFHHNSIENPTILNANRCVRLIGDNINDFRGDVPNSTDGCPEEDNTIVVGRDGTDIPDSGVPCNDLQFDQGALR